MLSRFRRDQIDASDAFLCVLPEGRFAGTEGELQLRYAIRRRKHIILFRAEDRGHLPIPAALDGYHDLEVVDGDGERLPRLIVEFLELPPGSTVELVDGEWK